MVSTDEHPEGVLFFVLLRCGDFEARQLARQRSCPSLPEYSCSMVVGTGWSFLIEVLLSSTCNRKNALQVAVGQRAFCS